MFNCVVYKLIIPTLLLFQHEQDFTTTTKNNKIKDSTCKVS